MEALGTLARLRGEMVEGLKGWTGPTVFLNISQYLSHATKLMEPSKFNYWTYVKKVGALVIWVK